MMIVLGLGRLVPLDSTNAAASKYVQHVTDLTKGIILY